MPFPATLEALESTGYAFSHCEVCSVCGEGVELWRTPGGRLLAMQPMCEALRPAVRHWDVCKPYKALPTALLEYALDGSLQPHVIAANSAGGCCYLDGAPVGDSWEPPRDWLLLPKTRGALQQAVYVFQERTTCYTCNRSVDRYVAPDGRKLAFDTMMDEDWPAVIHQCKYCTKKAK